MQRSAAPPPPERAPGQPNRAESNRNATAQRDTPKDNPLDSPANATAARLIAEGRARMAGQPEDDRQGSRLERRGRDRFDILASLTAIPALSREWFEVYRHRRRTKLAGFSRKQKIWYRVRLASICGAAVFLGLPILLFTLGYLFFSIPTPDDAVNKQIATVSYADGSEMARIVPAEGNRIKVGIDQVPKHVQYAVLSAEDRSFFSNPGFDPMGLARAAWKQLTGGTGGGSTITQQFVKKTLVGDEHSYWRKYKEMIIAVKISQQSGKDEILGNYLNAIYFGRGAYGIQSASQAYFGKNVSDLTPSEGALLAGVIQSPSRWDPAINPQRAVERWTFVMDGMVQQGWLTPQQRAEARFPTTVPPRKISGGMPSDYRGLILSAIRDELEQRGISEQEFNQEGLKITTTIDPEIQQDAVDAVRDGLTGQPQNLRGAMVSVDPDTGAILAYYGGENGVGLDYARVMKQPGSTFKPFVLLAALEQDKPIGLGTTFKGMPRPGLRNSDGASCEVCDIKQAMTISNNVVFHDLALKVGPQKVADAARQAGITTPLKDVNEGIALGNKEVTPVELASAYATFAAGGIYHRPHLVTKVTTSDDRVLYEAVNPEERRFGAQVARNVTEAMLGVPTYDKLTLSGGHAAAAKTGTVQSRFEGQNNDAWIAGFTTTAATAVWIGTDQNSPIKTAKGTPISGNMLPGTIWKTFMSDASKSQSPAKSFGPFRAIGTPPAETGPYDGYAAQPAQPSSAPIPSQLPFDTLVPNATTEGGGESPPDENLDGESQRSEPSDSDNGDEDQPEAQSSPDSDSAGIIPNSRQPVRG